MGWQGSSIDGNSPGSRAARRDVATHNYKRGYDQGRGDGLRIATDILRTLNEECRKWGGPDDHAGRSMACDVSDIAIRRIAELLEP